jgi:alkylation response protein AidB-like acyl-CoA dehydrogenase
MSAARRDPTMGAMLSDTLLDGRAILANARAIAPLLAAEAATGERDRRLTRRAVRALRSTGVFRMSMPRAWGGPEVDICTQVVILEELAAADGSAGWCAMIGADGGYYTAALDDTAGRRLYPELDLVTAGWVAPAGKLHRVEGGFRLEGRWQFGSGCTHADVIVGGAVVYDGAAPVIGDDGRPEARVALLPAAGVEIFDTWETTGLAGSGSHDYGIDGVLVPADQTFRLRDLRRGREGTLYAWPGMFFANLAAVPLGIARAALASAGELLAGKVIVPGRRPARDDAAVRTAVARAHAMVGAARSYVLDVLGDTWATLDAGREPARAQRAALAGMQPQTAQTCRDAVRLVADTVGSASIYRRTPIERHRRDLETISQHILAQARTFEMAGALWLGADTGAHEHHLLAEGLL